MQYINCISFNYMQLRCKLDATTLMFALAHPQVLGLHPQLLTPSPSTILWPALGAENGRSAGQVRGSAFCESGPRQTFGDPSLCCFSRLPH